MNFRDPILERANRLLLALARNDSTIVSDAIHREMAEHGEVTLAGVVEKIEEAVALKQGAIRRANQERELARC